MKAVVWMGGQDFEMQKVPNAVYGPEQVLIKVESASICTTDFHYDDFDCVPPIVPGHEIAGTIVEIGSSVKSGLTPGQRVTLDPVQRCWQCEICKSGISHLCMNPRHLGDTDLPGGWAEYVAVDAVNVFPLPDTVGFDEASLTEPAAVCMESYRRARFQSGQKVLIIGDGAFGFVHAMLARHCGAEKILVAGHYDPRLERIREKTGCLVCNSHDNDINEFVSEHCPGAGLDLVIEATGAGPVPNIALKTLRPRGSLVLFSYVWIPEVTNLGLIHMKELNVYGACRSLDCFEKCIELMESGALAMDLLIDIVEPLENCPQAMKKLKENKKNTFKAILKPWS